MRILRNILAFLVAVPVLGALVVFALPDADLDAGARRWLQWEPRSPDGGNIFEAMVGLGAASGQDPGLAGAEMVRAVNAALASAGAVEPGPEWTEPPLQVDAPVRALCTPVPEPCLESWRADADRVRALGVAHREILARYTALQALPAYVNTLAADHRGPLPPVRAILDAHRLWLAVLAVDFDPADPAPAVAGLEADLALSRRILAGAGTLLGKMVAASMFASSAALYAELGADAADPRSFPDLAPLGRDAIDPGACLAGEFRMVRSSIDLIHAGQTLAPDERGGLLDRIAPRMIKPNRATNLVYRHFALEAVHAGLPAPEYARIQRETGRATVDPVWSDYLLDPVGSILFGIAKGDLSRTNFRLHDLGGLVTLVNARLALARGAVPATGIEAWLEARASQFHGPYDDRPLAYEAEARVLAFATPGLDKRFARLAL